MQFVEKFALLMLNNSLLYESVKFPYLIGFSTSLGVYALGVSFTHRLQYGGRGLVKCVPCWWAAGLTFKLRLGKLREGKLYIGCNTGVVVWSSVVLAGGLLVLPLTLIKTSQRG